MTPKNVVDVIIVGASLAGSSLALHLLRAGLSVVITDSESFPRKKSCGDGLSALGLSELENLGFLDEVMQLPHMPFFGFQFFEKTNREALPLKGTVPHGIGIERFILDDFLLKKLSTFENAHVLTGIKSNFHRSSDRFKIENSVGHFEGKYLVFATGASSKLPQTMGIPVNETQSSSRVGMRIEMETNAIQSDEDPLVHVISDGHLQVCCAKVSPTTMTLAFLGDKTAALSLAPPKLPKIIDTIKKIIGVEGHVRGEPLAVSGIGRYQRNLFHKNMFTVGDATVQLDPIGGMGMTQALLSSRITAETIIEQLRPSIEQAQYSLSSHERRMKRVLRTLTGYTRLSYMSLVNPYSKFLLNRLKTGSIAKGVLQTVHSNPDNDAGGFLFSRLLVSCMGRL